MNKEQALKQIEELKLFIQSVESKENLNDERDKWFLSILKDLKIGEIYDICILYHNSKNELVFQDGKNGRIWVSYHIIWEILETKYNMEYVDIQEYIKDMLFKHLNWKVTTPTGSVFPTGSTLFKHLNWKVTTPYYFSSRRTHITDNIGSYDTETPYYFSSRRTHNDTETPYYFSSRRTGWVV